MYVTIKGWKLNVSNVEKDFRLSQVFLKKIVANIVQCLVEVKTQYMRCLKFVEKVGGRMSQPLFLKDIKMKLNIQSGRGTRSVILEFMTGLPNTTDNRYFVRFVDSMTRKENTIGQIYQETILEI